MKTELCVLYKTDIDYIHTDWGTLSGIGKQQWLELVLVVEAIQITRS